MPQIGWFELLVIIIVAILVIGPKDFPIVLKKIGSWVGSIKRYFSDVQKDMSEITNLEEKTKDKTLGSYRLFLSQNKNTPFRDEIEKNILHISTESNEEKEYVNFLESFPNSRHYTEAVEYLYYTSNKNIDTYKEYFDRAGIYDSLKNIFKICREN